MQPLHAFLLRVLFWLPLCFAGWYFFSIVFTLPLAGLVDRLMTAGFGGVIERVAQNGNALTVLTRIAAGTEAAPATAGELLFELNPLKYGYCVPLYTGLVLATPAEDAAKALRWVVGIALLTAVQVFGVGTEILKIIAFQLGAQARETLDLPAWGHELLALSYQLGYLILPAVAPIAIWLAQFRNQLAAVLGHDPFRARSPS